MQTARHAHVSPQLPAPNLSEIVDLQRQIARLLRFAQWLPALAFHHPVDPAGRGLEGMRARQGTRSDVDGLAQLLGLNTQSETFKTRLFQIMQHICESQQQL